MIGLDALPKIIDTTQLTSDLEGTFHYDHSQWIDMRLVRFNFLLLLLLVLHIQGVSNKEIPLPPAHTPIEIKIFVDVCSFVCAVYRLENPLIIIS